jgi:DNA-binding transcriptional regulator YhcF (GntR family)
VLRYVFIDLGSCPSLYRGDESPPIKRNRVKKPAFKHQRVGAEIRRLVQTLPVGTRLPAERSLAASYGCNFLTVRRALKDLVEDGTVVRRSGSGTYVSRHGTAEGASLQLADQGKRVGVLVCQGENAYVYRALQAIAQAGVELDVELRSSWVRDFRGDGLAKAGVLAREGCVALTLPWFPHESIDEVRAFVRQCPLPVSLPFVIPGLERNSFEQHEIFGGNLHVSAEAVCSYFHVLGHRRIALVGPDAEHDVLLQKMLSTYVCFCARKNLTSLCGLVGPGASSMDQLANTWKAYRGDLAVVSYDDEHALRLMTAMHKIGLSAPGDFKIIGYNDTEASGYSDPPLSTIRQSFGYIGQWLLKSALALARGTVEQSTKLPRPQMVVRATCGGLEEIDAAFRARLPNLDIIVESVPRRRGAAGLQGQPG